MSYLLFMQMFKRYNFQTFKASHKKLSSKKSTGRVVVIGKISVNATTTPSISEIEQGTFY